MRADASLVVRQINSWRWRHVTSVPFHHGRGFAGRRFPRSAWLTRLGRGVSGPLLPVLATVRIARLVVERQRHVGRMVRALPWILLYAGCWSLGESAGYLFGPGRSLVHWR